MELTAKIMKQCLDISYTSFVSIAQTFLGQMGTNEVDKILTIKVSPDIKNLYDQYGTIITIPYPNDEGYLNIYCIGSDFVKLITEPQTTTP